MANRQGKSRERGSADAEWEFVRRRRKRRSSHRARGSGAAASGLAILPMSRKPPAPEPEPEPTRKRGPLNPEALDYAAEQMHRCADALQALSSEAGEETETREEPQAGTGKAMIFSPLGVITASSHRKARTQFVAGKLIFACPACRTKVKIERAWAGEKMRCPRCHTAILAPDPRCRVKAKSMEREMTALAKPDDFPLPAEMKKLSGDWGSLAGRHAGRLARAAAIAVAAASFYHLMTLSFDPLLRHTQPERFIAGNAEPRPAAATEETAVTPASDAVRAAVIDEGVRAKMAVETVRHFLDAKGTSEKAGFVRDEERVVALMADYYRRHPEAAARACRALEARPAIFYADAGLAHPVTPVAVEYADYGTGIFLVEHLADGPKIEWESSVGYNPWRWKDLRGREQQRVAERPVRLRVMAALDHYYNYDYDDAGEHLCLRLLEPDNGELMAFGYLKRDSTEARALEASLGRGARALAQPMIVEVALSDGDVGRGQVRIERVVQNGWRVETDPLPHIPKLLTAR